jgi:cold shock CspA family protein
VRDSEGLDPGAALRLQSVRIYPTASRRSAGLDVDVEAVRRETVFRTTIALETYGFEDPEAARLRWQGKRRWIQALGELGSRQADRRLRREIEHHGRLGGPPQTLGFYRWLRDLGRELPEHTFLLQLGWGAGWESKTLGSSLLRQGDGQFERLLSKYRVTKERNRRPGDPFPRSRHLALVSGEPALPMGWVAVRIAGLDDVAVAERPEPQEAAAGQRTGRVKWFSPSKGYGFVAPEGGGDDVFLHKSGLVDPSRPPREGDRLAFDVEQAAKGPRAVNARVID